MSIEFQQRGRRRAMRDLSNSDTTAWGPRNAPPRVLAVEDERDTLMTLGILLRSEGYEVQLEHGSRAVLAAVREFRPHVVLLDISMPERDGYAVARELKATLGKLCPLLVAVTAYGSAADKARAMVSGFDHHVTKPYDPADLFALLDQPRI